MSLSFPSCVPEASRPPVVAIQAKAERELREALQQKPVFHTRGGPVNLRHCREHCASYVSTVVFALAHEVCKAARAGALSVDEIAPCVEEFIHKLTVAAYYDFELRSAWSKWEFFRDEMEPVIFKSDGWHEHLREREGVAVDLVGADSTNSPDSPDRQSSSNDKDKPSAMDKPLGTTERTVLLTIIAGLARLAHVDVSKPSQAGKAVQAAIDELGAKVGQRTIEEHLKKIPDALERRG